MFKYSLSYYFRKCPKAEIFPREEMENTHS